MRDNPRTAVTDVAVVRQLIIDNPWATMVSHTPDGLVASHYPFLLEQGTDELVLVSHVGRPDEELHRLGEGELLVIVEGPNGYVSPGWYGTSPAVPTWNFATVHAHGTPELLGRAENLAVLEQLVDRFEDRLPTPYPMRRDLENSAYAERIVAGTVGFRLPVARWTAKDKMSQDKPPEVVDRVIAALRRPGPYHNPGLADRMAAHRRSSGA